MTPDPHLNHAADIIHGILSKLVTDTRRHLALELDNCDGAPTTTPMAATSWIDAKGQLRQTGNNGSRGTHTMRVKDDEGTDNVPVTTVELAMFNRLNILAKIEQVNDFADSITDNTKNLMSLCNGIMRETHSVAQPTERCTANSGMDGYDVPLSQGGWHDPTCTNLPRSSAGLCDACRKRLDRFRARTEQKPAEDERIITHDSEVHYVNTVAHVRPIRGAA